MDDSLIESIEDVYNSISESILGSLINEHIRNFIKDSLDNSKLFSFVKCDEENNPPSVVDLNCVVATCTFNDNRYINLVFGSDQETIVRCQIQHGL